jgi:hypothetical protein
MNKKSKKDPDRSEEDRKFPLPVYSEKDDIYSREKEISLEDDYPQETKAVNSDEGPGEDLDVPMAELDDADEAIGEEDEENNYYSLGGDDHDDLEEDNG